MKPLRRSVAAVLFHESFDGEILAIKRQNYLKAFPGYTSFPGGKVDKEDKAERENNYGFDDDLINALFREVFEETGISLDESNVLDIKLIGDASTPEFNNVRFHTYFFGIILKSLPKLNIDSGEVASYGWLKPSEWYAKYNKGELLAVVPTIKVFQTLTHGFPESPVSLNIEYNTDSEVPVLEVIKGLKQFLPLSNTFPPANRTNSFLIGDEQKVLIDPSPKDEVELEKFKRSLIKELSEEKLELIFITHHHPDHHEFADSLAREYSVPLAMSEDCYQRILKSKGSSFFKDIRVQYLKEGDILTQSLGENVEIYEVPGHDEGQLAFAPKDLKWFMAGDLFQTVGTVVIGGDEGDMKKYFESLEKVIQLNPKVTVPSHGMALGGTYKIQKTLEHRKFREMKIREFLNLGKSESEILELIYKDITPELIPYAHKTLKSHIKKIESD